MNRSIKFSENLKYYRTKQGFTQKQLAEHIGNTEKNVSKWEAGNALPTMDMFLKVAELFKIPLDELMFEKTSCNYFLGIDGGGTKTEFLLTDINKNPINRIVLGPSNPVDIGISNALNLLDAGINEVCKGLNKREISTFVGIAGGITGDNKVQINRFISKYGFTCFDNGSDTENALELALHGKDGIIVIIGTGIIAFAQKSGVLYRIGGWGYHLDKAGSGYDFGSEALCSALKSADGRNGSKLMLDMIEQRLKKELPNSIQEIYTGGKAYIASFAPIVFDAYIEGDAFAEAIIDRNAKEIAEIISIGQKIVPNGKTVMLGGLCNTANVLSQFIKKHLEKNINIDFSLQPMVDGAVDIAKKLWESKKC